jgi:hypothetical protein
MIMMGGVGMPVFWLRVIVTVQRSPLNLFAPPVFHHMPE